MTEAEAWVMIPKLNKDETACTIDMRPLVLCKDCRFFDNYDVECMKHHAPKPPYNNWFCADGERREDDG